MSCEYCRAIEPVYEDESLLVEIDAMGRLHVRMTLGTDDESPVFAEKDARLSVRHCPMCGRDLRSDSSGLD